MASMLCQKAQNFVWFRPYDFVQIPPACGPNTYQITYGETLRVPMSALATVAGKSFNSKFTAKMDFPIGYFILLSLMLTLDV